MKGKYNRGVENEQETVVIHIQDGDRLKQGKRRTKTETEVNCCMSKIRVNTISVSNNLHMKPDKKYATQQTE